MMLITTKGTAMANHAFCTITLSGDYDVYNHGRLKAALEPAYHERDIVLNFSFVKYMDSTALWVLVQMHKTREESGLPLAKLAALPENIAHLLRVANLDTMWPCYETLRDAVSSITLFSDTVPKASS